MPIKPTAFQEEIATSPFYMSKEDRDAFEAKKKALDALLDDKELAKYKIEIMFGKDFSPNKPSSGAVSFWESGSKFHGGGDTLLHFCPGKKKGVNNCEGFIPDHSHGFGFLVCPNCHKSWDGDDVWGQVLARLDAQGWASLVLKYYRKLEMRADIVIKYHPESLRAAAQLEQEKQRMGSDLSKARNKRVSAVYPLKNIIKDTSAGADLEGRFLAFIRA
jgi:hypothetical protein